MSSLTAYNSKGTCQAKTFAVFFELVMPIVTKKTQEL
jgi:hypothetical protein